MYTSLYTFYWFRKRTSNTQLGRPHGARIVFDVSPHEGIESNANRTFYLHSLWRMYLLNVANNERSHSLFVRCLFAKCIPSSICGVLTNANANAAQDDRMCVTSKCAIEL